MNIKKRTTIVVGILAGILAAAGVAFASHAWGSYHWARTANPFTIKVVDSVTDAWNSYLDGAIADWSASSVLDLARENGSTLSRDRRQCKAQAGKIRACNYTYGNNGWLGLAQIWVSGTHITQATTKLNDTYFNSATYNTPAWRRLVACQEIAHDFGLDHQDENFSNANLGTCMDYTSDPDGPPSNEHPNAHDYEMIESIYAHLDGFSTLSDASVNNPGNGKGNGGAHAAFEAQSEWGSVVRSDSKGRPSLHERDLGGGNKLFTFVYWVD